MIHTPVISQCFGTYQVGFTLIVLAWCLQCRHEHLSQPFAEVYASSRHSAIWHGSHNHHVVVYALLGEKTELLGMADAMWSTVPVSKFIIIVCT